MVKRLSLIVAVTVAQMARTLAFRSEFVTTYVRCVMKSLGTGARHAVLVAHKGCTKLARVQPKVRRSHLSNGGVRAADVWTHPSIR